MLLIWVMKLLEFLMYDSLLRIAGENLKIETFSVGVLQFKLTGLSGTLDSLL